MTPDDWQDPQRHALGVWLRGESAALLLLNAGARGRFFAVPAPEPGTRWRGLLCSACEPPSRVRGPRVRVAAHSCLWLGAERGAAA
jgi:pullulanase/glycogen debranching enzyme